MVDQALKLAGRGWKVFPCQPAGKSPLTAHGYKDSSKEPKQIRDWWKEHPTANIAIDCGGSGLLVLDVDGHEGDDSILDLEVPFPDTTTVRTGKGRHYYFASNGKQYKNAVAIKPGLDIRTAGGSVIGPGSIHENGNRYQFINEKKPENIPAWLEKLLQPFEKKGNTTAIILPAENGGKTPIPDGVRGSTLASIAGVLRARGLSYDSILPLLLKENERCVPPKTEAEVSAIALSVSRYDTPPEQRHYTDLGNAERLIDRAGDELLYSYKLGKWFVWNGEVWNLDDGERIAAAAIGTIKAMYAEASAMDDPKERGRMASWALSSESKGRKLSMIDMAQHMVAVNLDTMDADLDALNVGNGIVDLRTGELRDFDPDARCTKQIEFPYEPEAECPRWISFLNEIFNGDAEIIEYVQRAVGYSVTGHATEQCFFILHGRGANGKSTLLETLLHVIGPYARQTQPETLMLTKKNAGQATPELAMLPGVRFLSTVETQENRKMNESLVKQLTGNDRVMARQLYAEYFEFMPCFKLWLASNHLPAITGTDWAIWRRIRKIPFMVIFPDDKQDRKLPDQLKEEAAGILAWIIAGALKWKAAGLPAPEAVRNATNEYRLEMDTIGSFLDECIDDDDTDFPTVKGDLYNVYLTWCESNGEKPISQRLLTTKLRERDWIESRSGKQRYWIGHVIKTEYLPNRGE